MDRKTVLCIIGAISVVLFLMANSFSQSTEMSRYYGKDIEISYIKTTHKKSPEPLVSGFSLNGERVIVTDSGDAYYSLVSSDKHGKNPKVNYSSNARLVVDQSEYSDGLVSSSKPVEFLFYNNEYYDEYRVFGTTLPLVEISTAEKTGYRLLNKESAEKMNFYLFDNRDFVANRAFYSEGKVHVRGASSSLTEKPSLKVSLTTESLGNNTRNNNVSLLGMRSDDDWALNSLYYDIDMARDYVSSSIWRDAFSDTDTGGFANYYEQKYTELIVDGEYIGLFLLGYKPDAKLFMLSDNPGVGESAETSYKFRDWLNIHRENEEDYDAEREIIVNEQHAVAQSESSLTRKARDELENYLDMLNWGSSAEKIISSTDMTNAINMQIFNNFIGANDNYRWSDNGLKNTFLTFKNTNNGRKAIVTPWDLDLTYGNTHACPNDICGFYSYYYEYDEPREGVLSPIYRLRTLGGTDISKLVSNKYAELRTSTLTDNYLNQIIDSAEDQIFKSGAHSRECNKYPSSEYLNTEQDSLAKFREFVMKRTYWADDYYTSYNDLDLVNY